MGKNKSMKKKRKKQMQKTPVLKNYLICSPIKLSTLEKLLLTNKKIK